MNGSSPPNGCVIGPSFRSSARAARAHSGPFGDTMGLAKWQRGKIYLTNYRVQYLKRRMLHYSCSRRQLVCTIPTLVLTFRRGCHRHYKYNSRFSLEESNSDSKLNRFSALVGTITTLVISGNPSLDLRTKESQTIFVGEAGLEYYWPVERCFCLTRSMELRSLA